MNATNLIAYLPFDTSTTEDKCGGTWTTSGSPTIADAALQLDGSSYLRLSGSLTLGGQDFTVSTKIYVDTSAGNLGAAFTLYQGTTRFVSLFVESSTKFSVRVKERATAFNLLRNQWYHVELNYQHSVGKLKCYVDGTLVATVSGTLARTELSFVALGTGTWSNSENFVGLIDEFMIYDGVALHTENFTPPTDEDYAALKIALGAPLTFKFDTERRISNRVEVTADLERILREKWRYVNAGTADTLTISGTTLTALPETQSRTGSAFYQTAREKCFDLPATSEVWMKFDVYFNGSNRWRAFNGGDNSNPYNVGVTAQTNNNLSLVQNSAVVQNTSNVCKTNTLQTVLLHMISGETNGVIEAWVDGTKIYRYSGDVNHGSDFADLYLQSDGAGTFFSNVIISNAEIDFAEGWQIFHYDVDRTVDKTVALDFDIERRVKNVTDVQFSADVLIRDVLPVTLTADLVRRATRHVEFNSDVELLDIVPVSFTADISRNIKAKFKLYATDTAQYFSGGTSTPIVIPTQDTIPPAYDSDANMQSIEISLSEQQLTDQVKLVGISPLDIMFPVQGQYLDYVCDMRVERVQRQGILYTVDCCSDVDELLYTPLNYDMPAIEYSIWYQSQQTIPRQLYPLASSHVAKIANALGLAHVIQFDDFYSTVEVNSREEDGASYADLIRDIFGWSSRVPTQLINVYIRNGKLFVVQRGHEANVIDISEAKKTLPVVTRELMRTFYQRQKFSRTQTRERRLRRITPTAKASDIYADSRGCW